MKHAKPQRDKICEGDLVEFQGLPPMTGFKKPVPGWKPGVCHAVQGDKISILVESGRIITRPVNRCRKVK